MVTQNTVSQEEEVWPEQGAWTYEDWLRLPDDGFRYEIIEGVLHVTPAPSIAHQTASGNLYSLLRDYARRHGGRLWTSPVGVRLPGQPVPFQPDLVFVSAARSDIVGAQYVEGVPDLVVEILSPSNFFYDRTQKFQLYRDAGVPEYWIVDPRAHTIEVYALEGTEYIPLGQNAAGEEATSRVLSGFAASVDAVFAE